MIDAPAAVLWDMDGTLVDTEPYWMKAEVALVESFGRTWTHDDCMRMVGLGLWVGAGILQEAGVDVDADSIVEHLTASVRAQLAEHGVPWRPGARELLGQLRDRGIPTALVTMSVASMAEQVAASVGFTAFDVIVSGDSVTHPKPHPEAYLTAADRLGVDPQDCVAIEDSVPGIESAVSAGTVSIGVPHLVDLSPDAGYTLWPSLDGRTADDIVELFRATRAAGAVPAEER
jgi:HAD superfamily hydrolase (TIGR01509 family)